MMQPLGPVTRWRQGDILYAENDLIRMAYVATDDPNKIGGFGWHGPDEIGVEYISSELAKLLWGQCDDHKRVEQQGSNDA